MSDLLQDIRYGLRMVFRTRLLSMVAILTIGLGIGSATFAFSVVYGALLRGLPVRNADRLMMVTEAQPADAVDGLYVPIHDYQDLRDQQTSFEQLAAGYPGTMNLAGDEGPPERVSGGFVTAGMLSMLGVEPLHGRGFVEGDDGPGKPALVLLGYDLWRNRFAADSGVVGHTARVNGESATIIGVMPPGFGFPVNQDLWVPLRIDPDALPRRGGRPLWVAGYLRDGVSREAAAEELAAVARRLEEIYPEANKGITTQVRPYADAVMPSEISAMLLLVMAMVAGVLLVACANVANILLARAVGREKEVAIRTALGASRGRVVRQLLTEALVLGVAGGVVGVILARAGIHVFEVAMVGIERPYWVVFRMDAATLFVTSLVTVGAAIVAGTIPALRASGAGLDSFIRDESRGSSGLRMGRFSTGLVVGELAVSCGLMIGAGLLVRTLVDMNRLDLGFQVEGVMTARVALLESDYPDPGVRSRFFHQLLERMHNEPGVAAAAVTSALPATMQNPWSVQVDGQVYVSPSEVPTVGGTVVTPGFFETFGVALREGRDFTLEESEPNGRGVVIVNRAFAERYLGGQAALGRRIRTGRDDIGQPWLEIVGVAPDLNEGVGDFGGGGRFREAIYLPLAQADPLFMSLVVRSAGPAGDAGGQLRRAVADLDPYLPLYWVRSMQASLDESTFWHRLFGVIFLIFGSAALFLAAVGLYGVIDFSVSSRVREMGVRMAMGAAGRDILWLVFGRVFWQLGVGVALGVALGVSIGRPLSATMAGVEAWDPVVYALIIGTMGATAVVAALIPALRAMHVDPAKVLGS
jgi:predicted permease